MARRKTDKGLSFGALRLGIERCDPDFVLGFYAEDAELSIVNASFPRVSPFELRGKVEIAKHLRATFGQKASHRVGREVVGDECIEYREVCEYPDGGRVVVETTIEVVLKVPSDPQDFLTTLEADLNHDTTGRLGEISTPSLVIGGSEDPFFSEGLLRETVNKMADATLHLYENVGQGIPKERKRRYEEDTLAFRGGHRGGSSGQVGRTTPSQEKEMR